MARKINKTWTVGVYRNPGKSFIQSNIEFHRRSTGINRDGKAFKGIVHKAVDFRKKHFETNTTPLKGWKPKTFHGNMVKSGIGFVYHTAKGAETTALMTETAASFAGQKIIEYTRNKISNATEQGSDTGKATIKTVRAVSAIHSSHKTGVEVRRIRQYLEPKRALRISFAKIKIAGNNKNKKRIKLYIHIDKIKRYKFQPFIKDKKLNLWNEIDSDKLEKSKEIFNKAQYGYSGFGRTEATYKSWQSSNKKGLLAVRYDTLKSEYANYRNQFNLKSIIKSEIKTEKTKIKKFSSEIKFYKKENSNFNIHKKPHSVAIELNKRRVLKAKIAVKLSKNKKTIAATDLKFKKKIFNTNKRLLKSAKSATASQIGNKIGDVTKNKVEEAGGNNDFINAAVKIGDIKRKIAPPKTAKQKLLLRERKISDLKTIAKKKDVKLHEKGHKLQNKRAGIKFAGKHYKSQKQTLKNKYSAVFKTLKDPGALVKKIISTTAKKIAAPIIIPLLLIIFTCLPLTMCGGGGGAAGGGIMGIYFASDTTLTEASEYYTKIAFDFNNNIIGISSDWKNGLNALGVNTSNYSVTPTFHWNDDTLKGDLTYDYDPQKLWAFITAYYFDYNLPDDKDPAEWVLDNNTKNLISTLFNAEYEFLHKYEEDFTLTEIEPQNSPVGLLYPRTGEVIFGGTSTNSSTYVGSTLFVKIDDIENYPEILSFADNKVLCCENYNPVSKSYQVMFNSKPTGWYFINKSTEPIYDGGFLVGMKEIFYFEQHETLTESVDLYYTVNRKQSFDNAVESLLSAKEPNSSERIEQYRLATGATDPEFDINGGHQTLTSPLAEKLNTFIKNGQILHKNGWDFEKWNYSPCSTLTTVIHKGIDIRTAVNTNIIAVADGTITNFVSGKSFEIHAVNLAYYNDNSKKYEAYIKYANVTLASGLTNGSAVTKGEIIGYVNTGASCGTISTYNYLHLEISTNQGSTDINIDPLLLIE